MSQSPFLDRREHDSAPGAVFVALCLVLPMLIVVANFAIGARVPITAFFKDDISLIDPVWRLVEGHQLGIDYHDSRGFGFFYLAALLWRWFGPHYYVLRAAADVFSLVIVACAFLVAQYRLRRSVLLSMLFCITVAVEASAPSVYGTTRDFGMALVYDRLIMAGLLVLFVQSFARGWDTRARHGALYLFAIALVLNALFLIKISGLFAGIAILAAGELVVSRPLARRMIDALVVAGFLGAMIVADFVVTGTKLAPVITEYRLAAQAQSGTYSLHDAISFALQWPVLLAVLLLIVYALWKPGKATRLTWRQWGFIIGCFWACQILLNMSNHGASGALLFLAPGAVFAVVTFVDTPEMVKSWEHWRSWIDATSARSGLSFARALLPLLILGIVLAHEGIPSLAGLRLDYRIASGKIEPVRVAAQGGIVLETLMKDPDDIGEIEALNDGIRAIERIGVGRQVIANLDFANPFPPLFLSPPPRGGWAYWHFGNDLPQGYKLQPSQVIGDACIVAQPKRPVWGGDFQAPLLAVAKPRLETGFMAIYEDALWKIWRKTEGCASRAGTSQALQSAPPGSTPVSAAN